MSYCQGGERKKQVGQYNSDDKTKSVTLRPGDAPVSEIPFFRPKYNNTYDKIGRLAVPVPDREENTRGSNKEQSRSCGGELWIRRQASHLRLNTLYIVYLIHGHIYVTPAYMKLPTLEWVVNVLNHMIFKLIIVWYILLSAVSSN